MKATLEYECFVKMATLQVCLTDKMFHDVCKAVCCMFVKLYAVTSSPVQMTVSQIWIEKKKCQKSLHQINTCQICSNEKLILCH